jgi:hypothetical protein
MRRLLFASLCVAFPLAACKSMGRAPGPEDLSLASAARGTLIVMPPGGGLLDRYVAVVDLPSLRERKIRLLHEPVTVGGVNAAGELVYAWDANAGVSYADLIRDMFGMAPLRAAPGEQWRLQVVDLADGSEVDRGGLAAFPRVLEPAPRGGVVIVAHDPQKSAAGGPRSTVLCIDLETGQRREVTHTVGKVERCDWKPDASAFALTGDNGGELIAAANFAVLQRAPEGFGPFTPDGSAYASLRGERYVLVAADDGHLLLEDVQLPWPAQYESPPLERAPTDLLALCGPRLGLYLGLPTKGMGEAVNSRGGYWRLEIPAIKVADLEGGGYATIRRGDEGRWFPGYSPVQLELLQH